MRFKIGYQENKSQRGESRIWIPSANAWTDRKSTIVGDESERVS